MQVSSLSISDNEFDQFEQQTDESLRNNTQEEPLQNETPEELLKDSTSIPVFITNKFSSWRRRFFSDWRENSKGRVFAKCNESYRSSNGSHYDGRY